jgi:hypothetical protein
MKASFVTIAIVLTFFLKPVASEEPASNESIVKVESQRVEIFFGDNRANVASAKIKRTWSQMPSDMKRRVLRYLRGDLGLSSTGKVELIGSYRLTEQSDFGKEGDQVFHFLQKDLFGERPFWSCLINVDSALTKVLYDDNAKDAHVPTGRLPLLQSASTKPKNSTE